MKYNPFKPENGYDIYVGLIIVAAGVLAIVSLLTLIL